jgi:hypothetical protein
MMPSSKIVPRNPLGFGCPNNKSLSGPRKGSIIMGHIANISSPKKWLRMKTLALGATIVSPALLNYPKTS